MPSHFRTVSFLLFLILASVGIASAQPGDQRTQEEIRRDLETKLTQTIEQVKQNPYQGGGYLARGEVYAELSWRTKDELEKTSFAEKALADFDKAIELEPSYYVTYVNRAQLRYANALKNFAEIRADYVTAIRLVQKSEAHSSGYSGPYESPLPGLFQSLSGLYLNRAEALAAKPSLIIELNLGLNEYSPWDDFDRAISYAQKAVQKHYHLWNLIHTLLRKGDAAYKAREYAIALAVYQSDEQYLGKDYYLFCENGLGKEWCERNQRQFTLMFSIRRGRAYLKLKQPERALAEFNVYFEKASHPECEDFFLLRAQLHWALGNDDQAAADEETAKKKSNASCPFDIQKR